MAVPAHDERDFEFCTKYALPIPIVIQPAQGELLTPEKLTQAFTEYGKLVNSGPYTGLSSEEALVKMTADAEDGGFGRGETTYRLRDWGISRQRYWGTPIPIIYCERVEWCPFRMSSCQCGCRLTWRLRARGSRRWRSMPEFVNVQLSEVRRCGAARDRYDGHVRGFVMVFPALS